MHPRDEQAIERLIRFPDTLSASERASVEHLIRTDPVAAEVAAFYRSFYEDLDALADEDTGEAPPPGPDRRA